MVNQPLGSDVLGEGTGEAKVGELIPPENPPTVAEQPEAPSKVIDAEAETTEPAKPRNEIKIVIVLNEERGMVGIQSPDCDPMMTTLEGTLETVLERIPSFVEEAKQQWASNPRHPKSTIPEPAPPPPPVRTATTAGRSKTATKPAQPAQPNFF